MFPFRYIIYGVTLICITLVYSLRLAFHSTFQCQIAEANASGIYHFLNDPYSLDLTFSSVSLGLLIGIIPLVVLNRYSTRKIIVIYCSLGVLSGAIYPTVSNNFYLSYIDRVVQGFPNGVLLWVVGAVSYEWAPQRELALASAVISSVYQLAPIIAMALPAEMCVTVGWQYTYYVLSLAAALAIVVFWVLYRNDVKQSRWVSLEEQEDILKGKGERTKIEAPVGKILRDPQVWLIWFVYYAFFCGMYVFLQYAPLFLNEIAGLSVRGSGWSAAAPHLLSFILKFMFGMILGRESLGCLVCRMKTGLAVVEVAAVVVLAPLFFMDSSTSLYLFSYISFNALNALAIIVIMKHMALMSGPHMHFLCNVSSLIVVVVVQTCSFVKTTVVPDDSKEQWLRLFAGIAVQMIVSVILYTFFARPVKAKWAEIPKIIEEKEQKSLLE